MKETRGTHNIFHDESGAEVAESWHPYVDLDGLSADELKILELTVPAFVATGLVLLGPVVFAASVVVKIALRWLRG